VIPISKAAVNVPSNNVLAFEMLHGSRSKANKEAESLRFGVVARLREAQDT